MTTMRYIITAIILYIIQTYGFSQITDPSFKNNYEAQSILKKSIAAYGGETLCKETIGFNLYGTNYVSGHFDTPEKSIAAPDTEKIVFHKSTDCVQYYGELKYNNRTIQSAAFVRLDSSFYLDFFAGSVNKGLKGDKNDLYLYLPSKFLGLIEDNLKTLSYLSSTKEHHILSWSDALGKKYNCYINKKTYWLDKVNTLVYHDLYGDCLDEVVYSDYKKLENRLLVPQKYSKTEHGMQERTLKYEKFDFAAQMDTNIIKYLNPSWQYSESALKKPLESERIANNLHLIKLLGYNNKVLVAEFSDYLMVFEAPKNTGIVKEIRESLQKQFPNKPIKYLALSHHHPDHAGGFAALAQPNTQIITTKGNIAYFEKLIKSTHTLKPENTISPAKLQAKVIATKDSLIIKDKDNQVVIYEGGENTDHVQEYLWFYFPLQKVLFVGDLVMFPQKGIRDQAKRAYSVYKIIEDKKLNVEKVYTSWPLKEQKPYGSFQDLKASLVKSYPDLRDN
jgi:glyoxylase-like metal-dependent hydrolase (beta-lactamase superfamily II)